MSVRPDTEGFARGRGLAEGSYRYFKSYILVTGPSAPPAARAFAEFALSEEGRAILSRNGWAVDPPAGRP
jgi:ABC-type Fe3+ transport system substrate-binding protein